MRGKSEPELVFRVETESPRAVAVLEKFTELLNVLYPTMGVSMAIETTQNGAIFFFERVSDFEKFHEIAKKLPKVDTEKSGDQISLHVKTERLAPQFRVEDYMPLVIKSYELLSPDVEVFQTSPTEAEIVYKNDAVFEGILREIRQVLGTELDGESGEK
ncbi:MAG: hypothetical protein ACTSU5_16265 [Promethearchaeota archaeon]